MKTDSIKLPKKYLNKMPANFNLLTDEPIDNKVFVRSGFYGVYKSRLSEPTSFYKPVSRLIEKNAK